MIRPSPPLTTTTPAEDVPALPAATLAVLREYAGDVEVLLLRRHPALRFLGGFWVFPGGAIDACEESAAQAASLRGTVDAAARLAACRELREEAGLSAVDPASLFVWARWITPTIQRKRFDTVFYVGATSANETPQVDGTESIDYRWLAPRDWIQANGDSDFPVTPPTLIVLRELAEALAAAKSLEAFLQTAHGRTPPTVLPKIVAGEPADTVILPWDPEYDALPGGGVSWDAASIAARADWPSRLVSPVRSR